ncbi:MAG: indole-3-glycerol phosphate synthase TrpC [Syntrophobacteraceae bacterium]
MSDFLSRIIAHKKEEIRAAAAQVPESSLRNLAENYAGTRRSLLDRLATPGPHGMNIIAEIKRSSPSKGQIRDDVDPKRYAALYEQGGAAAISVLTETQYFGGSSADLCDARGAAGLPVLRKDFIVSSYQVYESAAIGADAVLLIARALAPEMLKEMIALCGSVGLDALVEVHDRAELETALAVGARIIGINNRDLATFRTDIRTSMDLTRFIGPGHVAVAESGIHGRQEIEQLLEAGIFNFLIGESIMRADHPDRFLRVLHGLEL